MCYINNTYSICILYLKLINFNKLCNNTPSQISTNIIIHTIILLCSCYVICKALMLYFSSIEVMCHTVLTISS